MTIYLAFVNRPKNLGGLMNTEPEVIEPNNTL